MVAEYSYIWVSTNGDDANSGTESAPLQSIQHAIELAEPGTTIMVREGTYSENILIGGSVNSRITELTADKPLSLVSADGPGAAVIESADSRGVESTVTVYGVSHLRIDGFQIDGDVSKAAGANDGGALKIIGRQDANDPSTDIIIENNTFTGNGVSMMKLTMTQDALVQNNTFKGTASQNFIDMVTVWDTTIEDNDFIGQAWLGVTMKYGSQNNLIQHNYFDFENVEGSPTQTAILVGGVGYSRLNRDPLPEEFQGFEAKNISVIENVIVSASDYSVMFQGGIDSIVSGNVLGATGTTAIKSAYAPSQPISSYSSGNTVTDNILVDVSTLHESSYSVEGYVMVGNVDGDIADFAHDYGVEAGEISSGTDDGDETGLDVVPEGDHVLSVYAGGTGTAGHAPAFEVFVDGVSIGGASIENPVAGPDFEVGDAGLFQGYNFEFSGENPDRVEIVFLNDGKSDGVDVNFFVDGISLNGVTFETEAHAVFETANTKLQDILGGMREGAYVNGTFVFDDLPNTAPVIASPGDITQVEGDPVGLQVSAVDADGDEVALSVRVEDLATGNIVDPAAYGFVDRGDGTGDFSWTTTGQDAGTYALIITADDGTDRTESTVMLNIEDLPSHELVIRAGGTGSAKATPVFEVFVDGVSIGAASIENPVSGSGFDVSDDSLYREYSFELDGAAPETVEIVFGNDGSTDGINRDLFIDHVSIDDFRFETEEYALFQTANAKLQDRLGGAREDAYVNGTFVFDGLEYGSPNVAPEVSVTGSPGVTEKDTVSFVVSSLDANGDEITLSANVTNAETGAVLDQDAYSFVDNGDGSGRFTWETGLDDAGSYSLEVRADDGVESVETVTALTVEDLPVHTLLVRAGGTGTATAAPEFEVKADNVSFGVRAVADPVTDSRFQINDDALYQDYLFTFEGEAPDMVEIVFANDGSAGGVNRNLFVDYIELDGIRFETEQDGFFVTDSAGAQDALGGVRESAYVNGTFLFDDLSNDFLLP